MYRICRKVFQLSSFHVYSDNSPCSYFFVCCNCTTRVTLPQSFWVRSQSSFGAVYRQQWMNTLQPPGIMPTSAHASEQKTNASFWEMRHCDVPIDIHEPTNKPVTVSEQKKKKKRSIGVNVWIRYLIKNQAFTTKSDGIPKPFHSHHF